MLNYPHRLSLGAAHLHLTAQLVLLIYLGSLQGDTVKPAKRGPCRTVDPGRRRHDTPAFGMPAGRKLPAVTKNKNYPQPVKHLKPMALGTCPEQLIQVRSARYAGSCAGASGKKVIPARHLIPGLLGPVKSKAPQRQGNRDIFGSPGFQSFSGHHDVGHAQQELCHTRRVDLAGCSWLTVLNDQPHRQQQLLRGEDYVAAPRFKIVDRTFTVRSLST